MKANKRLIETQRYHSLKSGSCEVYNETREPKEREKSRNLLIFIHHEKKY
jgi:hypothetical protein